jgi:hypothetical protein
MMVPGRFAKTCTTAGAFAVGSATLVALTVTQGNGGMAEGAVYTPLLSTVPKGPEPPKTPLTDQVTLVLLLFVTAALKWTVPPNNETCLGGDTVIWVPEIPVPMPMPLAGTAAQMRPIRLGGSD